MSADEQPSVTEQLVRLASRRAIERLAQQALAKGAMAVSVKTGLILLGIVGVVLLVVTLLIALIAALGAGFQSSTLVWPVAVTTDVAGSYQASGWSISSRFGWRERPAGDGVEFHDGIDLVNPQGGCPFGYHCGAPSIVDGRVQYVGWDQPGSDDPSAAGGGEMVMIANGQEDHQVVFAHLEPYRVYVQLQGRIDDTFGRYTEYRDYQPIGQGELQPDLANGGIEMTCQNDMPNFIPRRTGPGTVMFLYDRPASCKTTVVWGARGAEWRGWIPDEPASRRGDTQRADLIWQTPIEQGRNTGDLALRFRAHLIPPPPPPTAVPSDTVVFQPTLAAGPARISTALPPSGKPRACAAVSDGVSRCVWLFADIPASAPSTPPVASLPVGQSPTATPTQTASTLAATVDPPIVQTGAAATLTLLLSGPPASTTVVLGLPTDGRIAWTIAAPHACSGTTLMSCPVDIPGRLVIMLTPDLIGESQTILLSIAVLGTHTSAPIQQSLPLTIVREPPATPTALPPTPSATPAPGDEHSAAPDCAPQLLVRLPNVVGPDPRLVAPAAASFALVRAEIVQRTGIDALAVLADALRQPSFTTSKPGVLQTSWHKAGRAIDLNQAGPFIRVAEGQLFRIFIHQVDITAIFAAHGWQRIPAQGDTAEWWHYEWHPDGIAWTSAMRQVWDLANLQAAFPNIVWASLGCTIVTDTLPGADVGRCTQAAPSYGRAVETVAGCGPPLRAGDRVYQLDTVVGFVGLTGHTTGAHLHLGLKVRRYDGSWPLVDICVPSYLQGRSMPVDARCVTDMADPIDFLPRAPANESGSSEARAPQLSPTPIIPEGAPFQLPPPNYPDSLVFTPVPAATPVGQYWSPYADGGSYGGGSVTAWLCSFWSGFPWCMAS